MSFEQNPTQSTGSLGFGDYTLQVEDKYTTAMHICARLGLDVELELLVSQGGDVNSRDKQRRTPAHLAAKWRQPEALKILLKTVCKMHKTPDFVNLQDKNGNSVTYWAGYGGCMRCVRLALNAGGKLSLPNRDNKTPLMAAVTNGKDQVVQYMLDSFDESSENMSKVDYINMQNSKGMSALHFAAMNNRDGIIHSLIDGGGDRQIRDSSGTTPLHCAAYYGNPKAMIALLMAGTLTEADRFAYVNTLEPGGRSPLLCAVFGECLICINILYIAGGKLTLADENGMTPLMAPCINGQLKLAEAVLNHFDEYREGMSVTEYIHKKDTTGRNALHHAAMNGYANIVESLIKQGGCKESRDNEFKTPLHYAAEKGHSSVMHVLLKGLNDCRKATFVNSCCFYKHSVMYFAVVSKSLECIDIVYEAGGIMSKGSYNRWTPLIAAAREGSHEVVSHLMKIFGKKREGMTRIEFINKTDDGGRTAMHYAAAFGHRLIFELLMDEGGDTKCRNIRGTTPSEMAALRIELLEESRKAKRRKIEQKLDSTLFAPFPLSRLEIRQGPTKSTKILGAAKVGNERVKYAATIESFLEKYSKHNFFHVGLGLIPI